MGRNIGRFTRLAASVATLSIALAPAAGRAGQAGPCDQGSTYGGQSDLCAQGPAGCVAVGVRVDVSPSALLPGGAKVELSRSQANAWSYHGAGYGHGDAHQVRADVPPTLGAGAVESSCDAYSDPYTNWAKGSADVMELSLDLGTYGIPVTLSADVLHETGWSLNGMGGNTANVIDVSGSVFGIPIPPLAVSAPPNTTVPLGPATLYLNEQAVSFGDLCPVYSGDALRLVVTDPLTGAPVAQVIVSWVSTSTCAPTF